MSVRSVAREARTTTRAVYTLFDSKDGLMQALAARAFELLAVQVDSVPQTEDPVNDLLVTGFVGFRGYALEHPDLFRLVLGSAFPTFRLGEEASRAGTAAFTRLTGRVARAQATDRLLAEKCDSIAFQLYATALGLCTLELCGMIATTEAESVWRSLFATLVSGWNRATSASE